MRKILKNCFLLYTILFFIIVIIGYAVLFKNNLTIIWNIDGLGQYFPTFIYTGKYLQQMLINFMQGNFCFPLYDLSIGLGEDIIGALNYYGVGDPLNLLAIFINSQNCAYIFTFMFFLRLWLAGLSFQLYCKHFRIDKYYTVIGALCYAFSGFAIYGGGMYLEWLSVLIYFPLILLGLEIVLENQSKPYLLVLAVAYGGMCGFYYLYMSSIFIIVYCVVRLYFKEGIRRYFSVAKKCILCLWWYIVGLSISAPIFIPAIQAYLKSERSSSDIIGILCNYHNYIPSFNSSVLDVFFNIFHNRKNFLSGIVILELIALVIIFILPPEKQRKQLKLGILMSILSLFIPIIRYIYNGFGPLYDRWVYIIHFLLALNLVVVCSSISEITFRDLNNKQILINKKTIRILVFMMIPLNIIINIWILFIIYIVIVVLVSFILMFINNAINEDDWKKIKSFWIK